jgi:endonuclease/exonuclease/phosphatase family metal-dependent hydrolase
MSESVHSSLDPLTQVRRLTARRAQAGSPTKPLSALARCVTWLTWLNLAAVIGVFVLLCVVSERWWISAVLTYLPRSPYAAPATALLLASLFVARRAAWVNALAILLVVGPIMGVTMPTRHVEAASGSPSLRVLTCNAQNGDSSLPRLIYEIDLVQADLLIFQETARGDDELDRHYTGWNTVQVGEYRVSSKSPVRFVSECVPTAFGRRTAILCEVDAATGPFRVACLHLNTPRKGVDELRWHSAISGSGKEEFEAFQIRRELEARETRQWIDANCDDKPLIVAGDFNCPSTSSLFASWRGLTSAFEAAGTGYGYTIPCSTDRVWPHNWPWARIDHILCSSEWAISKCEVGHTDGSDHRLIWADVALAQGKP